MKYIFHNRRWK